MARYERLHCLDTFLSFRRSIAIIARGNSRLLPSARAARFIYLNKTCFNGLWRTNKVGQFNVPMDPGSLKGRMICDTEGLKAASIVLQRVSLVHGDFVDTATEAKRGDLIYFDPPTSQRVRQATSLDTPATDSPSKTNDVSLCAPTISRGAAPTLSYRTRIRH